MPTVHPTAIVHPSARLAESVVVGPYCVIGAGSRIGDETTLASHVVIGSATQIGRANQFHPFCVIGADPQDRKFHGESTTLIVGDGNIVREHVTIHRGTANGGGSTRVGSHNLLMVGAHIAHDCIVGDHIVIANQALLAGHVRIDSGATISGGVGIHHYASIGTCAFVGGLARISKDVPPFMIVEGSPAEVRGPNRIGMERRGYAERDVDAIKDAYKRLFRESSRENGRDANSASGSSLPATSSGAAPANGGPVAITMSEKISALRCDYPQSEPIRRLCEFLLASADGVHGRANELTRLDDKRALRLEKLEEEDDGET